MSLGRIHVVFAILAMLFGAIVVIRRKGTRPHRALGWIYVISMLGLNITALMIYRLFGGFGPFHAAAIVSLASILAGMYFVVLRPNPKWLETHYMFMSWSYAGLLAAFAAEVGTRVEGFQFWWAVLIATFIVIGVGRHLIYKNKERVLSRFGRLNTERVPRKPYFNR